MNVARTLGGAVILTVLAARALLVSAKLVGETILADSWRTVPLLMEVGVAVFAKARTDAVFVRSGAEAVSLMGLLVLNVWAVEPVVLAV